MKHCSQFSLRHSKYSRILRSRLSFNRFLFFFLSVVGICTIFISHRDCRRTSFIAHVASWCLVLEKKTTACLADILLYHVDIPDCSICLVVQQALRGRWPSVRCGRDVVQTHRSNQWLLEIFYISNRFPIDPMFFTKVLSFLLVAARSAPFAL